MYSGSFACNPLGLTAFACSPERGSFLHARKLCAKAGKFAVVPEAGSPSPSSLRDATSPKGRGKSTAGSFFIVPNTLVMNFTAWLSLWESWQARQGLTERAHAVAIGTKVTRAMRSLPTAPLRYCKCSSRLRPIREKSVCRTPQSATDAKL